MSMEISRLTRDGSAEPVSRDQILRHERGRGNINFSCSADQEQDWQPHPGDPYSCYMCDHTSANRVVIIYYCFIGCKDKTSTWHLTGPHTLGPKKNILGTKY